MKVVLRKNMYNLKMCAETSNNSIVKTICNNFYLNSYYKTKICAVEEYVSLCSCWVYLIEKVMYTAAIYEHGCRT